jgi:uncharacterized Zn-binding protein involved in type VI secretion
MSALARIGDKCSGICRLPGHSPQFVTNAEIVGGSDDVKNSLGAARLGDTVNINCSRNHTTTITEASSKVFVNGIAVAREGDSVGTGADFEGTITEGSSNTNAG